MDASADVGGVAADRVLRVGKIPVRNIWLLMLYASDLYRQVGDAKTDVEDNPDEIADLVAEILSFQVERRLRRNLSFGYQDRESVISRVRGRIDTLYTECHRLLEKGKVRCRFEELTVDTPLNRYVRAALERLSFLVRSKDLSHRCRSLAMSLERLGVSGGKPSRYSAKSERFGLRNVEDQKMATAADLAFSLAFPAEIAGWRSLPTPEREGTWLRILFEKAVAGFYSVVLDKNGWRVDSGNHLFWQTSEETSGVNSVLPRMITDITIRNRKTGERLIIDTKFTSVTNKGRYKETLKSGYIYQIYAYLRSQERCDDPPSLSAKGMLLHPCVDGEFDESVTIQGHRIRFCTVNLGGKAAEIRERLKNLYKESFDEESRDVTCPVCQRILSK